jgi:transcriptional regulator
MSLYVPAHFASADAAVARELVDEHAFATLVTPGDDAPFVTHLPLLREAREGGDVLVGHFARANPHWQAAAGRASLAIFHGPHAYVSPSWYVDPAKAVPTWNYATVHAHGALRVIDDPAAAERVVSALTARFEGSREAPWTFAMAEPQRAAMLRAIVAFEMPVVRFDVKLKLSQNRPAADRRRVIAALATEPFADARATAELMRRRAPPPDAT